MEVFSVSIERVNLPNGDELSDTFYSICQFCDKIIKVNPNNFLSCKYLSGTKFYCPFCLRHNRNLKNSNNILMVSYRGIIGYYYHKLYLVSPEILWLNQINDLIEEHEHIGLQNPVFSYDASSFVWFIDFNRIGKKENQAPYEEVLSTLSSILDVFKLKEFLSKAMINIDFFDRIKEATDLFFEKRNRPKNRKALIPTLSGLVFGCDEEFFETTRNFTKKDLHLK